MKKKVNVISCDGIAKVVGQISRESVVKVVNELCPGKAAIACLGRIVMKDEEVVVQLKNGKCITLDGCKNMCASKNVENAGVNVDKKINVLDTIIKHKGIEAGTPSTLTLEGWELVDEIADEITVNIKLLNDEVV